MRTLIVVGNEFTRRIDGLAGQAWLYTPRRIDEASSRGAEAS